MDEKRDITWRAVKATAINLFFLIMGIVGSVSIVVSDHESGFIKYVAIVVCAMSGLALLALAAIGSYCIEKRCNEIRDKYGME